jgi:hypothetical protein
MARLNKTPLTLRLRRGTAAQITATAPAPFQREGEMAYATDTKGFYVSDGTQFNLVNITARTVETHNATEGQSNFSIGVTEFDFLDVYLNGARLISSEYTVSGSDIILGSAAELDDEVIIISYDNSSVIDINSLLDNVGSVGNDLYLFYNY